MYSFLGFISLQCISLLHFVSVCILSLWVFVYIICQCILLWCSFPSFISFSRIYHSFVFIPPPYVFLSHLYAFFICVPFYYISSLCVFLLVVYFFILYSSSISLACKDFSLYISLLEYPSSVCITLFISLSHKYFFFICLPLWYISPPYIHFYYV